MGFENIGQVMDALVKGKKLCLEKWRPNCFLRLANGDLVNESGNSVPISFLTSDLIEWQPPKPTDPPPLLYQPNPSKRENYHMRHRIDDLQNIVEIQCSPGNWDQDEYMRGMANGLSLAWNILMMPYGHEPQLFSQKDFENARKPS